MTLASRRGFHTPPNLDPKRGFHTPAPPVEYLTQDEEV